MVIAHNIPALQTYNIVNNTSNALQKSIAKLSSGLRINSAADDAAGLAISEKMRSQVRGLDRAVANTQDGISLIQTAEGALSETHSILQRMRELSVQAANDTLTQQDRSYIQEEVDQLKEEITRIGNTTQFNKKKLLNGDSAALWSSNNMETKAIIKGGLRDIDQFGQKKSVEGNYRLRVTAEPGQGEVQKSDIMTIKHPNVLTQKSTNINDGVKDVQVTNMTPGVYSLSVEEKGTVATEGVVTGSYGVGGTLYTRESVGVATPADGSEETHYSFFIDGEEIGGYDIGAGASAADIVTARDAAADSMIQKAADMGITLDLSSWRANTDNKMTMTKVGSAPGKITITQKIGTADATEMTGLTNPDATSENKKVADIFTTTVGDTNLKNGSVLFEVTNKDTANGTVTLRATGTTLSQDGKTETVTQDNILLKEGGDAISLDKIFGSDDNTNPVDIKLNKGFMGAIDESGKFTMFFGAGKAATHDLGIQLTGSIDTGWENQWSGGPFNGEKLHYVLDGDSLKDSDVHFRNYIVNSKNGEVSQGDIDLVTNADFKMTNGPLTKAATNKDVLAAFTNTYIGKTATGDVKLRDLDKFWNSEGTFMLEDAKTLTLNQGNGETASITLYANDTLNDVADKINNAIATGLGQSKYVDDATKFATFVSGKTDETSESVPGTFVIRSVVPGAAGEITFSGDQGIIDAFSLNTIQESKETTFSVDAFDAHTGEIIAQNVKTTGNIAYGLLHDNVDVEFSSLSGIKASWNDATKKFTYSAEAKESTLHLADNTTVLQIGANEGEDLGMNIGDMRAHALGLDGVNVMSHDRAARSITVIDNAIDKVSTQRANLGAYQNRLEYTANNLTTASENLTSAESRIRDADMAKEMMQFTKLNIMLQAGNSMLAQANQQPQNVLSLIR
ncbi:MAG: flagellin [Synergistaceae bacterium]|nr:flagellin [Synergistaceae bacterium]